MRGRCFSLVAIALVLAGFGTAAVAPAAQASPELLAAMQRDLGLTAQQARIRLTEERLAGEVLPRAERAAGAAFGGAWFDPGRGRLVVGITDPAVAAAVRATGASTTAARITAAALNRAKVALDGVARTGRAPSGIGGWYADPRSGTLVVSLVPGAHGGAVEAFLARARRTAPVRVRTAPEPRPRSAGTVGGDPYYINGNVRCSIGFSVQGGFVSAGHCGRPGSSVAGWDRSAMGSFAGSSFPGNDYSFIRIDNGWYTTPVVLGWGTVSDQLVRGSRVAPAGSSICRSGSTSHWHCGTVLGLNETINYADGAVYEATHTNVCAEPGDSGGSFISGDQAQGVTSGGFGNCTAGGETWFQPVNEILQTYNLSLVTA